MHRHNIVPLCQPCHTDFDAHTFDIGPFLTAAEEARLIEEAGEELAHQRAYPSEYDKLTKQRLA